LDDELWVLNRGVYFSMGGASRTMVKDILSAIDAEIACLEHAKALLSAWAQLSPSVSLAGQQR